MSEPKEPLWNAAPFEQLAKSIGDYTETKVEIIRLKILGNIAKIVGATGAYLAIAVFGLFFLAFLSGGMAVLVGQWLGSVMWGLFAVAGFYLLMIILLFVLKDKLITNRIIKALLGKYSQDDKSQESNLD